MALSISESISRRLGPELFPVYVLSFGSLAGVALPVYFTTGGQVPGITSTPHAADWPTLPGRSIQPLQGTSSFGKAAFSVLSVDGYLDQLLSTYNFKDREAVLSFLLNGVPWTDRLDIHSGRISEISRGADGMVYRIEIGDQLEKTGRILFQEADIQAETGSGGDKVWPISGSITGSPQLTLRDNDADGIYDTVILEGHPLSVALCLLLSGSGEGGTYDVFPSWAGAGLTTDEVDVSAWEAARDDQFPLVDMKFTLKRPERLKNFLEQEIFRVLGGYPSVSGDGKVSCRFFEAPSDVASLASFTDADLLGFPRWSANLGEAITHIDFEMDHDGDSFQTALNGIFVSEEFMAGRILTENRLKISSRGLQTSLGGISIVRAIADSIFRRYQKPPPKVQFEAMLWKLGTEAGDVVSLEADSYPNAENPEAFGRGVPRYVEIVSSGIVKDRVRFQGLDLSAALVDGERIAIIAPSGTPAFTSATSAQKRYAFLAGSDDKQLSTGAGGYRFA